MRDSENSRSNLIIELRRINGPDVRLWLICLGVLLLAFSFRLIAWARFALGSDLYSYTVLIPFVSLYLISLEVKNLRIDSRSGKAGVGIFSGLGLGLLAFYLYAARQGTFALVDLVGISIASFLALLVASLFFAFGKAFVYQIRFPLAFLIFAIPFPEVMEHGIQVFFQRTSAEAAAILLGLAGIPMLRDGMIFKLPGITIEVAEECSGIRSSLVLFLVSLVAGSMLLRQSRSRLILTLFIIPLAIIRNGFRILTISWLCVHVHPSMIDSPIHHRGGPIFFALSLIPFFGVLVLLRRRERNGVSKPMGSIVQPSSG